MMSQQINFKHTPNGLVYYSLVQKESNSGVSYNKRILVVLSQQYIGYISKPNTKNMADSIDLDKVKSIWPFNTVASIKASGNLLIITTNKGQKWQFKTKNQIMSEAWEDLLHKQMHKGSGASRTLIKQDIDLPYQQPNNPFESPKKNTQKSQTVIDNKFSLHESPIKNQSKSNLQNSQLIKSGEKFQRQAQLHNAIHSSATLDQNRNLEASRKLQQSNSNLKKEQVQAQKVSEKISINNFQLLQTKSEYYEPQHNYSHESKLQNNNFLKPQHKQKSANKLLGNSNSFQSQNRQKSQSKISNHSIVQQKSQRQKIDSYQPVNRQQYPQSEEVQIIKSRLISKNGSQIFNIVTPDLPEYKKQQKLYQMPELKQIEQQLHKNIFVNYFRQEPANIDENRYNQFIGYAKKQFFKLLKGQIQLDNLEIDSPRKIPKKSNIKTDYNFSRKVMKNKQQQAYGRPNPLTIQMSDITIVLPLTQLKQVPFKLKYQQSKYASHNICDQSLLKQCLQELKNYDYIWQCLMRYQQSFRQRFLLPMCCVIQYAGWVAIVKSNFSISDYQKSVEKKHNQKTIDSSDLFDKLSQITHISRVVFEDPNAIQIVQVTGNKFVIASVRSYLPRLGQSSLCLRSQSFIDFYKNDKSELYPHHCSLKQKETYFNLFKIRIEKKLQMLIKKLENFESYFMHPLEISATFHHFGINIKQIGYVSKKVSNLLTKSYLKAQIAARAVKIIFRKKMQQEIQKLNSLSDLVKGNGAGKVLIDKRLTVIFLNLIFGSGQDHQMLWKIITLHSQVIFGEAVNTIQLSKGYFLLSIQHQLGIKIKAKHGLSQIFSKQDFIQSIEFDFKVRKLKENYVPLSIEANQLERVVNLWEIIKEDQMPYEKYAENICKLMGFTNVKIGKLKPNEKSLKEIKKDRFPVFITEIQLQMLKNYLANFIPPKNEADQLQLYDNASQLTIHYCRRQLLKTKWLIKMNQLSQTQPIKDQIYKQEQMFRSLQQLYRKLQAIHKTSPEVEAYPFVSEIRQLLSAYYISKKKFMHAIHQSKFSLTNLLQVCGSNMHVKIANSYYQLSQCYISALDSKFDQKQKSRNSTFQLLSEPSYRQFNAFQEASNCLKKSKNILQANLLTKTTEYALIQAELGKANLMLCKDDQSSRLLRNAIRIMRQNDGFDISDMINCYQLLIRSLYNDPNSHVQVSRQLLLWVANQMNKDRVQEDDLLRAQQFNQLLSDELLQKVTKIIIEGQVTSMMQKCYRNQSYILFSDYLIELSIVEQTIPRVFTLKYVRDLFSEGNFAQLTKLYFQQFQTFLQRIQRSRLSLEKDHDLKQFQKYVKNINGLLGDGVLGQMMSNYILLI